MNVNLQRGAPNSDQRQRMKGCLGAWRSVGADSEASASSPDLTPPSLATRNCSSQAKLASTQCVRLLVIQIVSKRPGTI